MADFHQDHTPLRGAWEDSEQTREELTRRSTHTGEAAPEAAQSERRRRIAEAAYHRAQLRGFAPGYEEEDWLEAEKEIDAMATEQHWGDHKYP
jgi:hypothetical protein